MDNIKIHQVELINGEIAECVIIDRGNGEYTSMPKSTYDEQQAALSTPIDTLASELSNPSTPQAGE